LQVVLLQGAVEIKLGLAGPLGIQLLVLAFAAFSGCALGLLVSCFARSQERAVLAIPLLLLPQIVFSEFVIPREAFGKVADRVEEFMPVRWAYRAFAGSASAERDWADVALGLGVLAGISLALLILARLLLSRR